MPPVSTASDLDDDQRRAIIKDALDRITIHPRTRPQSHYFDPDRVDFGHDVRKPMLDR